MTLPFHDYTLDTAPDDSKPSMQQAIDIYGMLPNLVAKMAVSPSMVRAYLAIGKIFDESSFSNVERHVVLLTVSRYHNCSYCVGVHSVEADNKKVPVEVTDAIRNNEDMAYEKLHVLRVFTEHMLENRACMDDAVLRRFYGAGFTQANVLDVIVGISMKTLSNYTNHIADTELDKLYSHRAWNENFFSAPLLEKSAGK